jgi:spermidine/putrescine transport system ATP-binding protein
VANFLGTSNLLAGRVGPSGAIGLGPDERVVVPGVRPGAEVEVAVRPEKTTLRPAGVAPEGGVSRVRGKVTEVVYLGSSTSYTVAATGGATLVCFQQNFASEGEIGVGDEVWVAWRPEHSWVLGTPSAEGAEA